MSHQLEQIFANQALGIQLIKGLEVLTDWKFMQLCVHMPCRVQYTHHWTF